VAIVALAISSLGHLDGDNEKIITAREIVLVDDNGNVRSRMGVGKEGYVSLEMLSSEGKPALLIRTLAEGGILALGSDNGRVLIQTDGIGFSDASGMERASLELYEGSWPGLFMRDPNGAPRAVIEVFSEDNKEDAGQARLVLGGPGTPESRTLPMNPRIRFEVTETGEIESAVTNDEGVSVWRIP
jgi:hypothetical protein